jgi:tetratricopeptide (TPR) repeat protein
VADHDALRRAIAAQESLRGTVSDHIIDAAVSAMRARLANQQTDDSVDEPPARHVVGADIPIVGREVELGVLQQAYSDVVELGQARVVNLIGEPGIGKSRLLDELSEWIDLRPARSHMLRARSDPEGRSMPLHSLHSLVAHRLEIRNDDTGADVAIRLRDVLSTLSWSQADIVGHWLGFDLADSPAVRDVAGNPELGTIALGHLIAQFRPLLTTAPAVLLLEDLQWSDSESLDVIGHIVDAFYDASVLVVCAARPSLFERRPGWSAGPREATVTIELPPLDEASRRTHVRHLLHRANEIPTELLELLAAQAGGNPLHAEELVALLVDNGIISTDVQPWDIDRSQLARFAPPTGLRAVIQARLDALPANEATVLQHGSVIGPTFWDDTLVAAATASGAGPSTHTGVASSLARLRERALIRQHEWSIFTGCREYAFRHTTLRDASGQTIAPGDRAAVHRAAARWLERRSGDRLGEHVALLAEHLSYAGELDRAADLLHEAGARASETAAEHSALVFYQRSLDCRKLTGEGDSLAATATRIELAHILASVGRNDEALATYHRAETDATRSESHRLAANAMAGALRTAAARGYWEESARLVEHVRPLAERFGGEILGRYLSGRALLLIDGPHQDLDVAQQLIEQALEIWRQLEDPASELRTLNELGLVDTKAGRFSQADRWFEEGLALARRVGDTNGEWKLLQNQAVLAHLEARAGRIEFPRVLELYRLSLDSRRRLGLPHLLSLANLAQAEVEAGHLDDGRRHAAEALSTGWMRHDPLDWTIPLITFAQLAFVDGRPDDGFTILGSLLANRRTPSLESEIDAVLDYHDIDRSTAAKAMSEAAGSDLADIVDHLLEK